MPFPCHVLYYWKAALAWSLLGEYMASYYAISTFRYCIIWDLSSRTWLTVGKIKPYFKSWKGAQNYTESNRKNTFSNLVLDVDPQRDDDASPMSTYRCMLRPTWMISALQHKSKYKSNSISNFFEKKNQIFWFPWCSTHEDLSVDVSITCVGLILTKPGWFFFSVYENSGYGQNSISSISNFLKKNSHFWVSMV